MTGRLDRSVLRDLPKTDLKTASRHKADLYVVNAGGREFVIKDFADKPWFVRLLGRVQISQECLAYEHLGDNPFVPEFGGRIDSHALAIEYLKGCELIESEDRFSARRRHIAGLRRVFDSFIAAGFVHLDSRGRHNVMIRSTGEIVVVDLAGSICLRRDGRFCALFGRCILRFYAAVLFKWRKLLTESRYQRDEKNWAGRLFDFVRQPHHWFRRRKQP